MKNSLLKPKLSIAMILEKKSLDPYKAICCTIKVLYYLGALPFGCLRPIYFVCTIWVLNHLGARNKSTLSVPFV